MKKFIVVAGNIVAKLLARPMSVLRTAIQRGEHTLIFAPTGSGKTLAAFLAALAAAASDGPGCRSIPSRWSGSSW